jgi:hypothetical protein
VRGPRSGRDIRGRSEPGRRSDESVRRVPTQQRHKRQAGDLAEYRDKELEQRRLNPIPDSCPIVFLEIEVGDPSDFAYELDVRGVDVDGYRVLRTRSPAVLNALAAIMLRIRDETDIRPHLHFQWSEGHPLAHLVRFILLGLGETAPVTREILRQAEQTSVADRSSTSAAAPRSQTVLAPVTSAQPLRRQQLDFVSHPSRDQERTGRGAQPTHHGHRRHGDPPDRPTRGAADRGRAACGGNQAGGRYMGQIGGARGRYRCGGWKPCRS